MQFHGHGYGTQTYKSFHCAKQRCENPKHHNYHNYGGKGIEFRFESFQEFLDHIGVRPDGTTLDRIDNDGHYEPGNVRWADSKTQIRNSSRTILNEADVKRIKSMLHTNITCKEIALQYNVSPWTIHSIKQGKSWVDVEMGEI